MKAPTPPPTFPYLKRIRAFLLPHKPTAASPEALAPVVWVALLLSTPALLLLGVVYWSYQAPLAALDLSLFREYTIRFLLSAVLAVGPLAVMPLSLRGYARLAWVGLLALFGLNMFHALEFGELVTIGSFDAVAHTSTRESLEFLANRSESASIALATAIALLIGGLTLIPRLAPVGRRIQLRERMAVGALALLTAGVLTVQPFRLFPLSTLKNAADYAQLQQEHRSDQDARAAFSFGARSTVDADEAPEVVVLVVGESLRRQQLGLYGYSRETTPRLSRREGLVAFSDAVSASNVTQTAVKAMLTRATARDVRTHSEKSIVALAEEVGVTTTWLSNQDRTDDSDLVLIAEEAHQTRFINHSWSASGAFDERLLDLLDETLDASGERQFVVLHTMGSHEEYSRRYPERFAAYPDAQPHPRPELSSGQQSKVDHYDNSIRYTDWLLDTVIERVAATGRRAWVVYVSDHGENLYEAPHRQLGHGMPGKTMTPFEVEVPLLVWASDAERMAEPGRTAAAEQHRALPVTTADLFYALADLLGADFEGMEPTRSVFSEAYLPPETRAVLLQSGDVRPYVCIGARTGCPKPLASR